MKINEDKNKIWPNKNGQKMKLGEFIKDKKTRWMIIALVVMVGVTILQFVLPNIIK